MSDKPLEITDIEHRLIIILGTTWPEGKMLVERAEWLRKELSILIDVCHEIHEREIAAKKENVKIVQEGSPETCICAADFVFDPNRRECKICRLVNGKKRVKPKNICPACDGTEFEVAPDPIIIYDLPYPAIKCKKCKAVWEGSL